MEIEDQIIQGQERVLGNIQGVTSMVSSIARDQGYIELNFEIGWDMQQELIDVITNLNQPEPNVSWFRCHSGCEAYK